MNATPATLEDFYRAWELYSTPALTGAIVGLTLGVLGVYIVLRRMVFLAAALAQAASLGVALTFFLGTLFTATVFVPSDFGGGDFAQTAAGFLPSPTVGAMLLTFLATLLVANRRGASSAWRDAALGAVFLVGSAGTLALGTRIVEELHDIDTLLFGSAVAVMPDDFALVAWLFLTILGIHAVFWRGFTAASFDYAGAKVRRLPVRTLELLMFASLALTISVGTRVVGALPVFALSVLPAVAAARLAPNLPTALFGAAFLGLVSGFYGYLLAFLLDLPVGASQALVAACLAGLAEIARALPTLFVFMVRTRSYSPVEEGRLRRFALPLRAGLWLVTGCAFYLLATPALAGIEGGLAAPEVDLALVIAALAVAALGLVAAVGLRRVAVVVSLVLACGWLVGTLALDIDAALVRPLLLAGGAFMVATSLREARLPPVARSS